MAMPIILALSFLTSVNHGTQAAPSQSSLYPPPAYTPHNFVVRNTLDVTSSECNCPGTRTLLDILWSCITTVLICTWVSVHPNVAPVGEKHWRTILRRLKVMFWGLITPELIVGWSLRQWVASRKIAKENNHRGWTQAHGFLFVMGGFSLMKDDEDLGTLSYTVFTDLLRAGDIDFPVVSIEDIKEKSKGDPLSKALVIFQTTWFIAQCIGRGVTGLAVTELEIVTLAFCSLNAIIYFFWWHKPLDIQRRVPIYLKPGSNYRPKVVVEEDNVEAGVDDAREEEAQDKTGAVSEPDAGSTTSPITGTLLHPVQIIKKRFHRLRDGFREDLDNYNIFLLFLFIYPIGRPLWFLLSILGRILLLLGHLFYVYILESIAAIAGNEASENIQPGLNRVNTFYSPALPFDVEFMTCALYSIIGCAFGALHCIAWDFHFPSHTEQTMWRSISLTITFIPLSFFLAFCSSIRREENGEYKQHLDSAFLRGLEMTVLTVLLFAVALYIPCRMILLVQTFIALRDIPPSVYLTFSWQNYVPHL